MDASVKKKLHRQCVMMYYFCFEQDFMAGKLPALRGEVPTLSDWENHLTTIYPEVNRFTYMHIKDFE
jgi:glutamate--cysteine ligase